MDGGMKRMLGKDQKSAALAAGLNTASASAQPDSVIPRYVKARNPRIHVLMSHSYKCCSYARLVSILFIAI